MIKQKIIYIIGAGRSGTTLLEIILGNSSNIFNTGEINHFPLLDGIPKEREKDSAAFKFWVKIKNQLSSQFDLQEQRRIHEKFEYHSGLVKYLLIGKSRYSSDYVEYQQYLKSFYSSIFEYADSVIVSDSSKYPGRALQLSRVLEYDISYIYIIRNPVDVVNSFSKKNIEQTPKGWFEANIYYFVVNTLCKLVVKILSKRHKVTVVDYDLLVNFPVATISNIAKEIEVDLSEITKKIEDNESFDVSPYLFDGNRTRLNNKLKIKPNQNSRSLKTKSLKNKLTYAFNLLHYRFSR